MSAFHQAIIPMKARKGAGRSIRFTSVLFDMGGTLEDIYVDERSEWAAIEKLRDMLASFGLDPGVDGEELKSRVDAGWVRYGRYRDSCDVELKPIPIWRDYVLADFLFLRSGWSPTVRSLPICGR